MRYISRLAQGITPYVPGEQPQDQRYIKINTNENPYPPSPATLEAARGAIDHTLRLYPDPETRRLREVIAAVETQGWPPEDAAHIGPDNVFVGNGSDEVLAMCFQAYFNPEGPPILFPDVTYSFYPVYASLYKIPYRQVPLDASFCLRSEDYEVPNGGILFPNPNAPTGICKPLTEIEPLIRANLSNGVVIIDEAYIAFGGASAACLIPRYPNLLIVRTLSKSHSLAGMRVGYALGQPPLIEGLNRIKNSINSYVVDRVAQAAAAAALSDREYYTAMAAAIAATRQQTIEALRSLGASVLPSGANFVFMTHPDVEASELYRALRAEGILVRYFAQPRIDRYLRVTIGTDTEMGTFIAKLKKILDQAPGSRGKR